MTEEFFTKIITGGVAPVGTVGIITAENPDANKLTKIGNDRKNKELIADLEKDGFAPIQMKGKFAGQQENPFLIINITRDKLVELAKKYKQQSVIYGEKKGKEPFEFMYIQDGKTTKKGKLGLEHPKNLLDQDCYFVLSGKKFNIHFKS